MLQLRASNAPWSDCWEKYRLASMTQFVPWGVINGFPFAQAVDGGVVVLTLFGLCRPEEARRSVTADVAARALLARARTSPPSTVEDLAEIWNGQLAALENRFGIVPPLTSEAATYIDELLRSLSQFVDVMVIRQSP